MPEPQAHLPWQVCRQRVTSGRGVKAAWDHLIDGMDSDFMYPPPITHAIWAGFNISCLRTCPGILRYPLCVPSSRVRWIDGTGNDKATPRHDNVFVYLPGEPGGVDRTDRFLDVFSRFGEVKR